MLERFYPSFVFNKVEDIPINFFIDNRINAVIFDMDNTLVDYTYRYNKELKTWLKMLKKNNIKVCILSNSIRAEKVKKVGKELAIRYLYNGVKPWTKGFKKAQELLGEKTKESIAIIGDQIFTDIYGGNRFGIKTILVNPIEKKEFFGTRIKRPIERIIIAKYNKRKKDSSI